MVNRCLCRAVSHIALHWRWYIEFDFSEHTDYVISIGSYHMLLWMKPANNHTLDHIWTMEIVDATTAEIESTKVLGVNKESFKAGK